MLVGFGIHFWWPYERGTGDVAKAGSGQLLAYLQSLAELEPSFASIQLPGEGDWRLWTAPTEEFVQEFSEMQYILTCQNGDADIGYRSVFYNFGTPHSPAAVSVVADDELLLKSKTVAAILRHGIQHLPTTEAGAAYDGEDNLHFWLRWVKSERPGTPIPDIPVEAGWASEEPLLDGRLYTWPQWEPRRLIT
jgi:hypothetical protein